MTDRVQLHPASIKHIKNGHPWITKDSFSSRFPKGKHFLASKLGDRKFVILLNDPAHPNIKARVWKHGEKSRIDYKEFSEELRERLIRSYGLRNEEALGRENYYLAFGEADGLPGLFIQKLKDQLLVQMYSLFWDRFEKDIISSLKDTYPGLDIWFQKRNHKQEKLFYCSTNKELKEKIFNLNEFGVNYEIRLNKYYDNGIYTDMSAIRKKIGNDLKDKSVLNLYSYTGAYSLFALKNSAKDVTSVDLSPKYIEWLKKNISLNDFNGDNHHSIVSSTEAALKKFIKEEKKFDYIICDPPSASSDGKKTTSAIDSYRNLIPLIEQCLNPRGEAIVFLNTHGITRRKFEDKIKSYIKNKNTRITGALKLNEDCPSLKGFPEGDYLKGIKLLMK